MPMHRFKRWLYRELIQDRDDMIGDSWFVILYGTAVLILLLFILARCTYGLFT